MTVRVRLSALAVVLVACQLACAGGAASPPESSPPAGVRVLGYLTDYSASRIDTIDLSLLTDVILFSLEPGTGGTINQERLPDELMEKVRVATEGTSTRVHVSVGGWGRSSGFPDLAASRKDRLLFADNLLDFCRQWGLAGVDYDWEFPASEAQQQAYLALLRDTKRALRKDGLEISIAVPGHDSNISPDTWRIVDRLHLMSYDHAAPHASMAHAGADIAFWRRAGCPPGKIFLGVPFYGRNDASEAETWASLHARGASPESDSYGGFHYNGCSTLSAKVQLVREHRLGGIMIWQLGQDVEGEHSLLRCLGTAAGLDR